MSLPEKEYFESNLGGDILNTNLKNLKFLRVKKPYSTETVLGMLNNDQRSAEYHRREPGEEYVLTIAPGREFHLSRVGWRVPKTRIEGKKLIITMPAKSVVMFCYTDKPQKVVVVDSNP